jgi:Domain of unknown function (DUF5680)
VPVRAFLDDLLPFIVAAKSSTYAVDLAEGEPSRPESHDRTYRGDRFTYLDSKVGGTDFLGQEVVYLFDEPVWAMNYYGYIIDPSFTPEAIGRVLQPALTALYHEGRFLGGFEFELDGLRYTDTNIGSVNTFRGMEWVEKADADGKHVYELVYHGGLIRP